MIKLVNTLRRIADLELDASEDTIVGSVHANSVHNTKAQSEHAILVG